MYDIFPKQGLSINPNFQFPSINRLDPHISIYFSQLFYDSWKKVPLSFKLTFSKEFKKYPLLISHIYAIKWINLCIHSFTIVTLGYSFCKVSFLNISSFQCTLAIGKCIILTFSSNCFIRGASLTPEHMSLISKYLKILPQICTT